MTIVRTRTARLLVVLVLVLAIVVRTPGRSEALVPVLLPAALSGKALLVGGGALLGGGAALYFWQTRSPTIPGPTYMDGYGPDAFGGGTTLAPTPARMVDIGSGIGPTQFPHFIAGQGLTNVFPQGLSVEVTGANQINALAASVTLFIPEATTSAQHWVQMTDLWVTGTPYGPGWPDHQRCNVTLVPVAGPGTFTGTARCNSSPAWTNMGPPYEFAWEHINDQPSVTVFTDEFGASNSIVAEYRFEPSPGGTPRRVTIATLDCYDPATDTTSTLTQQSDPFDAPVNATLDLPMPGPDFACPPGTIPSRFRVVTAPATGTTGETITIVEWEQDDLYLNPTHPLRDCLVNPQLCTLRVVRVLPDGSTEECNSEHQNCVGWYEDAARGQKYRCMWGTHRMALSDCYQLRTMYNPPGTQGAGQLQPLPGTQPATPGAPAPTTDVITRPSDPALQPQPGTPVQPQPPGVPQTPPLAPAPGTGSGTELIAPPATVPESGECFPSGWGLLNPVEWVLKPIKCALVWAFVPSPATMTRLTDIAADAATKAPFSAITSFVEWFEPIGGMVGGGGTCLHLTVPILGQSYKVVSTCNPGTPETIIMGWRPWLTVVANAWLVVPLAWWAWKQYAPGSQGLA